MAVLLAVADRRMAWTVVSFSSLSSLCFPLLCSPCCSFLLLFLTVLFPLAVVLLLFGSFDGAGGNGEDAR